MWYCDECGEKIKSVEDGWVEWKHVTGEENSSFGLRLVHHLKCMYPTPAPESGFSVRDSHVESFLDQQGLLRMLEFLQLKDFKDPEEVYRMIKRLQIRDFEQARFYFEEAVRDGYADPHERDYELVPVRTLSDIISMFHT